MGGDLAEMARRDTLGRRIVAARTFQPRKITSVCAQCGEQFTYTYRGTGRRRAYCDEHGASRYRSRRSHGSPTRRSSPEFAAMRRDYWIDAFGEPRWTRERVIAALQADAKRRGRTPTSTEWGRGRHGYLPGRPGTTTRSRRPSLQTVYNVLGSWRAALEAAGLDAPPRPRKTHCKNGHEFTADNTMVTNGGRACRICKRAAFRRWYSSQQTT